MGLSGGIVLFGISVVLDRETLWLHVNYYTNISRFVF
jgi:hypothetical protein